ncbi:membrane protein [Bacteroidia bacterium]|nr:membrane protein [Bacteroidia bacterium]
MMSVLGLSGQTRYAFVDMEFILKNVPDYGKAKEELNAYSLKLQTELDSIYKAINELQEKYVADKVFLTPVMRDKREKEIADKENKAQLLQQNYFGPKGELYKRREELMRPIFDEINEIIRDIAKDGNFGGIWDVSVEKSIVYFDPKLDRSALVLKKMGYSPEKAASE